MPKQTKPKPRPQTLVEQHIYWCTEVYGEINHGDLKETVERAAYEQMRADLLIALGMLSALLPRETEPSA